MKDVLNTYKFLYHRVDNVSFLDIKKMVSDHTIENEFQIGDYIVVPWTNPADNKDYDMPFIVAHFSNNFKDENGDNRYGVGFISQYSLPESYMFDNKEPNNFDSSRQEYGNSRWKYSNIRQWLNKSGFNWYKPQYEYDNVPTPYDKYKGFLDSLPSNLVDYVSLIQVNTQTPSIDRDGMDSTTDKFFLLSLSEMNLCIKQNSYSLEGEPWQLYLKINDEFYFKKVAYGFENKYSVLNKKFDITNSTNACNFWSRSALYGNSFDPWCIGPSGNFSQYNEAHAKYGLAPAFVIVED